VDVTPGFERPIAGVAALDLPVRRDLYQLLRAADGGWLSRDEASDALGIGRPQAAFHLDKLVEAGVVETRYERRTGRSGPGAGRPSKLYRPREQEVSASVPDRHYDLAGSLLVAAVAEATTTGAPALANCPFHRLAEQQRPLVCGMNLDFLGAVLEGLGPDEGISARLQPEPGYCCVRVSTAPPHTGRRP
jgi:predicted ArsR family transcriptional regulator